MPNAATLVAHYIGKLPPGDISPNTIWTSQSAEHWQVPHGQYSRTPIIGSAMGQTAAQEMNPWYNPTLHRYECTVNMSAAQWFSYAPHPAGPWATPVKVLGGNTGGETGNAIQCSVHLEGSTLYAFYTIGSTQILLMATAPLPTDPNTPPVFTKQGAVATSALAAITGSPWVMKALGKYYLFWERGSLQAIGTSDAATMANLVTTPFVMVAERQDRPSMNLGARYFRGSLRPQVFLENGKWIMMHHGNGVELGSGGLHRSVSVDPIYPTNWDWGRPNDNPFAHDDDIFVAFPAHPVEIDQIADFRFLECENERVWMFNTAADNRQNVFSIMATPIMLPDLQFDGGRWTPIKQPPKITEPQFICPDIITGNRTVLNRWDAWVDTKTADIAITLPSAASHAAVKLKNMPTTGQGNLMTIALTNAADKIFGGNPITAISASGTTVTVTTKRPHGLSTSDKNTVSGVSPSGYNVQNTAVTGIPAPNQWTYTAGSSPAAATVLGFWDRTSFDPGEAVEYRCSTAGLWLRK